jgi:Virulence factor BrkB
LNDAPARCVLKWLAHRGAEQSPVNKCSEQVVRHNYNFSRNFDYHPHGLGRIWGNAIRKRYLEGRRDRDDDLPTDTCEGCQPGFGAIFGVFDDVSLVVSTGLTLLGDYLDSILPFGKILISTLNGLASFLLISILFAAIYKVLPDRPIAWREVALGSAVTALLFIAGKSLIGWYVGSTAVASSSRLASDRSRNRPCCRCGNTGP